METASGLTGMRARWHEIFSQFDLSVLHKPRRENVVTDAFSRWAYPANVQRQDVSQHGDSMAAQQVKEMETLLRKQERETGQTYSAPSTPGDERGKKAPKWDPESYRLVGKLIQEATEQLGVCRNQVHVDLFASEDNVHERLYITKERDALSYDWSD